MIDNGQVEMKQVEYEVEETVKALEAWDIEPRAKAMLTEVYRTGKYVAPVAVVTEEG